ncbi:MAG: TAXI family TRAP transporter solute-binding subunit [Bacillota bacterium]|nr:TAXI family TRAP transporter solute-binding subunit [Bacillota bacterium]MDD3297502.1 TAXI family TRAP transporter solute-binding subunit [Bacillota bacterium]MDD3851068.1 TAXI family TRAP transporter solute-binding subunit [Bacillota bacterium]MDD4706898.1 TAXI family TRAP transporter solute-binding subunit [Bacillota bacterium]
MRKKLALLLVLLFVFSTMLVGCSTPGDTGQQEETEGEAPEEAAAPAQKIQVNIITGSTGGTYFALGGAMANTWNEFLDNVQVTSQPGGASVESINRVHAGECELGMAMNNIADDAWKGQGAFPAEQQNFRAIGVIYPEVYQGVALKESGITSIEGLKGKRVAVGPVGSGTVVMSETVFNEAGLTFDDVKAAFDGFGDAASKMKDGHLDAAFNVLAVPAAAIQDIMTARDIEVIEIGDDLYKKVKAKYPFFSQYVIPAGTYGNEEDKLTINCVAALYVAPEMSEDAVYDITKVWFEQTAHTAAAHGAAQWLADEIAAGNKQVMIDGITTPLHPGAYKYFTEIGLDIPDMIKPID